MEHITAEDALKPREMGQALDNLTTHLNRLIASDFEKWDQTEKREILQPVEKLLATKPVWRSPKSWGSAVFMQSIIYAQLGENERLDNWRNSLDIKTRFSLRKMFKSHSDKAGFPYQDYFTKDLKQRTQARKIIAADRWQERTR